MIIKYAISYKCFAFLQLIEQHKKASLPSSSLAEVFLVMGNMKDDLGLFVDAQQLWQEALDMYQQECSALGLKERQVQLALLLAVWYVYMPDSNSSLQHKAALQLPEPVQPHAT